MSGCLVYYRPRQMGRSYAEKTGLVGPGYGAPGGRWGGEKRDLERRTEEEERDREQQEQGGRREGQ